MRKYVAACLIALGLGMTATVMADSEPTKAINFQFTDITGKSFRLSDFQGKWVLVNFWAPWCPLCWVEVPALNDLNKRKDFVVIGIGLDYGPDEAVVRDAAMRHNLDFFAVVAGGARRNPDSPFRQVGPVDFYPTSYLYDPNGEIVMFIPGQVRLQNIHAFMESWNAKHTKLAGEGKAAPPAPASEIKEVDYSKPKKTPALTTKPRKTTTY